MIMMRSQRNGSEGEEKIRNVGVLKKRRRRVY
jgi:hypothetical protein